MVTGRREAAGMAGAGGDDDSGDGFLVWEALRRCGEGTVVALVEDEDAVERLAFLSTGLPELARPIAAMVTGSTLASPPALRAAVEAGAGFSDFDFVIASDFSQTRAKVAESLAVLAEAFSGAAFATVENLPRSGGRLSLLLEEGSEAATALRDMERIFYSRRDIVELGRTFPELRSEFEAAEELGSVSGLRVEESILGYDRSIDEAEIEAWLSPASLFGSALASSLDPALLATLREELAAGARRGSLRWPLALALVACRLGPPKA